MSFVDAIFKQAFDPSTMRNKRSEPYKQGVYAALKNAVSAKDTDFQKIRRPYDEGTASSDAWYSGNNEGRHLWRVNGGEHGLV